ncbi:MAG: type II secretion system protein [Planctomycetes bacterium]|nr:type II secretion system protein [Planctomycetota bacterium]
MSTQSKKFTNIRIVDLLELISKGAKQDKITMKSQFTIIELLIIVSLFAILTTLTSPAIKSVIDKTDTVICMGQLNDLYILNSMYQNDNDDYYIIPGWDSYRPSLTKQVKKHEMFKVTWDDILSEYDGRNLDHASQKNQAFAASKHASQLPFALLYVCPADKLPREFPNVEQPLARTYSLNACGVKNRGQLDEYSEYGIGSGINSVRMSDIEDIQGTILMNEASHKYNSLGSTFHHKNGWPNFYYDSYEKSGFMGLHETNFNTFLITDGHTELLLIGETAEGIDSASSYEVGGMWSRQAGD